MKKFGFAAVVASGLAAAVLGFAAPAQASDELTVPVYPAAHSTGVDHLDWLNDLQPKVNVPQVDTGVHQSR
jgi:ABC-type glycerol-3-phosphate transport system substrate-binding protein